MINRQLKKILRKIKYIQNYKFDLSALIMGIVLGIIIMFVFLEIKYGLNCASEIFFSRIPTLTFCPRVLKY